MLKFEIVKVWILLHNPYLVDKAPDIKIRNKCSKIRENVVVGKKVNLTA